MTNSDTDTPKPRKRSMTELTLGWLAERIKKAESIKDAILKGEYTIDSKKVAESLVELEKH